MKLHFKLLLIISVLLSLKGIGQTNPGDIIINEFMASNDSLSGISDSENGYADWIELYNNTEVTFLLNGYHLYDSIATPTKWTFPDGIIFNANSYLLVFCDGDSINEKGIHTNFKLAASGEEIVITTPNGNILDSYSYESQNTNISMARKPNLAGLFEFSSPSPKADNDIEIEPIINSGEIVINELMAMSDIESGIAEPDGGYPDWIELYNNSLNEISLAGYFLSDNANHKRKWAFTNDITIAPNGYLLLWADGDVHQNGIHTNFKLSAIGESLYLSYYNENVIDEVNYPQQSLNLTYARLPNGTGEFSNNVTPTVLSNNNNATVAIENQNNFNHFNVSFIDNVHHIFGEELIKSVRLYSSNGQLLKELTPNKHKVEIDVQNSSLAIAVVNNKYILKIPSQ